MCVITGCVRCFGFFFFFFNDTATTEIYTLSLHDALPISFRELARVPRGDIARDRERRVVRRIVRLEEPSHVFQGRRLRSEEHTSELQSQSNLVCRLLLEKKKKAQETPLYTCPHSSTYATS